MSVCQISLVTNRNLLLDFFCAPEYEEKSDLDTDVGFIVGEKVLRVVVPYVGDQGPEDSEAMSSERSSRLCLPHLVVQRTL